MMSIGDNPGPDEWTTISFKEFIDSLKQDPGSGYTPGSCAGFSSSWSPKWGHPSIGNYWPAPSEAGPVIQRQDFERLHFIVRNQQTLDRMAIHAMNAILKTAR